MSLEFERKLHFLFRGMCTPVCMPVCSPVCMPVRASRQVTGGYVCPGWLDTVIRLASTKLTVTQRCTRPVPLRTQARNSSRHGTSLRAPGSVPLLSINSHSSRVVPSEGHRKYVCSWSWFYPYTLGTMNQTHWLCTMKLMNVNSTGPVETATNSDPEIKSRGMVTGRHCIPFR